MITERLNKVLEELKSIYSDIEESLAKPEPTPTPEPTPEPTPAPVAAVEPKDTNAFTHNGIDFYVGSSRAVAIAGYQGHYGKAPVDNDPVNGIWYSASKRFGPNDLPSGIAPTVTAPAQSASAAQTSGKDVAIKPTVANQIGAGWVKTNDGVKWSKTDRYSVSLPAIKTDGVLPFEVDLAAGTYTIEIEARAGDQTAGRHDLHNDVWFWMDGILPIRKQFWNGRGDWAKSTTAEDSTGNHAKLPNTFTIPKAGKYVLNMSGRSSSAEVRAITLKS